MLCVVTFALTDPAFVLELWVVLWFFFFCFRLDFFDLSLGLQPGPYLLWWEANPLSVWSGVLTRSQTGELPNTGLSVYCSSIVSLTNRWHRHLLWQMLEKMQALYFLFPKYPRNFYWPAAAPNRQPSLHIRIEGFPSLLLDRVQTSRYFPSFNSRGEFWTCISNCLECASLSPLV